MIGNAAPRGVAGEPVRRRVLPPPVGDACIAPIGSGPRAPRTVFDRGGRRRLFCSDTPPLYTIGRWDGRRITYRRGERPRVHTDCRRDARRIANEDFAVAYNNKNS